MTAIGHTRVHGSSRDRAIGVEVARIVALVAAAILSIVIVLPVLLDLAARG